MPTVQHVVQQLVTEKPFLHEALRRGIVNNAALAESLRPDVEKTLQKDVTFSAVNMAVRRLEEKLEKRKVERVLFDKDADITLRSHLVEITVFKTDDLQERTRKLYDLVDLKHGDFLTITQGLHEVMVITNAKHEKKIAKLFGKSVKSVIAHLSSITVHIPEKSTETIGLFYVVTRALTWENINIVDIVSTYTELTFIIEERHTGRAFDILKALIAKNT